MKKNIEEKKYKTGTGQKKIVKVENLKVIYNPGKVNEAQAIRGVSFDIYENEYVIFFGPSGCGKSTILNVIAGLEVPSDGKVLVDDQDPISFSTKQLANFHRNTIGMIFQSYNLISTLSVLENVTLPQIFDRKKPRTRKKLGMQLLNRLGMDKFESRLPQELSGGQQQRVSIARALINDPPIILADEAVGNLDSVSAKNVLSIIEALNNEENKTIISVTHNPEHLFYADRVFYVKDGLIVKIEKNEKRRPSKKDGDSMLPKGEKQRSEIDLLLQAYPDLSSMQLHVMMAPFKAKILANYLLNRFESKEMKKFEKIITDRLIGRVKKKEFCEILDRPVKDRGMGLNKQTAEKFSEIIEEVVEKSDYVRQFQNFLDKGEEEPVSKTISQIRMSILDDYDGDLSLEQVDALNKGIEYRITGKINKKEFEEYLDRSFKRGGVGFRKSPAKKLARKMELIMLLKYGK
ncbi:MAG: ABC transporter ATP-binding protein [Patescibacteria group bacterium]